MDQREGERMSQRIQRLADVIERVDGARPGAGLAKHKKMAISPFVMLRGASAVFYDDIASGFINLPCRLSQWPLTTIMGDCHISNFGFFSEEGSHSRNIVFAPNDFDDACIAHAGWDLFRFAVSLVLCADHCQGFVEGRYPFAEPIDDSEVVEQDQVSVAILGFLDTYCSTCEKLVDGKIDYDHVLNKFKKPHILRKSYKKAKSRISNGESFQDKSTLAKAVDLNKMPLRFRERDDKFQRLSDHDYAAIKNVFAPYVDDQIVDIVARLGAGTGSVNMERYYLLVGPGESPNKESLPLYHIVEIKKQRPAAPLYDFSSLSPVNRLNSAHLTVVCQRRMQRRPDLVLDEVEWRGQHWLVRSRHHAKVGIDPENIASGKRACDGGFAEYAATCGEVLALAHSRGDKRSRLFERCVVRDLPEVIREIFDAVESYANQIKKDWSQFIELENGNVSK